MHFSNYLVTCVIMQKNGAGLHTASSCFWDNTTDGSCTIRWENKSMYAIVTVFGLAIWWAQQSILLISRDHSSYCFRLYKYFQSFILSFSEHVEPSHHCGSGLVRNTKDLKAKHFWLWLKTVLSKFQWNKKRSWVLLFSVYLIVLKKFVKEFVK